MAKKRKTKRSSPKSGAWAKKRKAKALARTANSNARGARAVRRKNKAIEKSYSGKGSVGPVAMPIPEIHIDPVVPVKLIVPADVQVKVVRRQTWMEYLFGTDRR